MFLDGDGNDVVTENEGTFVNGARNDHVTRSLRCFSTRDGLLVGRQGDVAVTAVGRILGAVVRAAAFAD